MSLLILQNALNQNIEPFFESPDKEAIINVIKDCIRVTNEEDAVESKQTFIGLKILSVIANST